MEADELGGGLKKRKRRVELEEVDRGVDEEEEGNLDSKKTNNRYTDNPMFMNML